MTTLETLTELVDEFTITVTALCNADNDNGARHNARMRASANHDEARTALLTALAAVVRDAERYRWLRNIPPWTTGLSVISTDYVPHDTVHHVLAELDAAVDAAIKASGEG